MNDIQFDAANIFAYESIPSGIYGTLDGIAPIASVRHSSGKSYLNSLPDPTGISVNWMYPLSNSLSLEVSVGYQLQVFSGLVTSVSNKTPIFERIVNSRSSYVNLSRQQTGSYTLSDTLMLQGEQYTARVRNLVFSHKGNGTLNGEYFKYTSWGYVNFSINTVPNATSLMVDGYSSAVIAAVEMPTFSFVFNDSDGPSYSYQIQVGTDPITFSPNIWDSGLIAVGSASGIAGFSLKYAGTPLYPGTFYWRVYVDDGLTTGSWSPLSSFVVSDMPVISNMSLQSPITTIDGIMFSSIRSGPDQILSWTYVDAYPQTAYVVTVVDKITSNVIFNTGVVYSSAYSISLPTLPSNGHTLRITVKVKNLTTFSAGYFVDIDIFAKPSVSALCVEGENNPLDVGTNTPTFSWTYTSFAPQSAIHIQVANDQAFTAFRLDSTLDTTSYSFLYPDTLPHGAYFIRLYVYDEHGSESDPIVGFFAVNSAPTSPTILSPSSGAYSGTITVNWLGATDSDGDPLTYSLEITKYRSTNTEWEFLAGPFPGTATSFGFDTSLVPAGNDYGLRIVANDGFIDSVHTSGSMTALTAQGLGFTILSHAPKSPTILYPAASSTAEALLYIEWIECSPPSIDGIDVSYILEITSNISATAPIWEVVGTFTAGTSSTTIDISSMSDGMDYAIRITAIDAKGNTGTPYVSSRFAIENVPTITDFKAAQGMLFLGSSDGKIYALSNNFWDFGNFQQFDESLARATVEQDGISLTCPAGTACIFRDS